jgi:O-antigen ligase
VLVDLAILTQTRSSVVAFPVVAAAAFVLVPGRVRQLLALVPIAVAVLLTLRPLLDLFEELDTPAAQDALRDVTLVVGLSALAVTAAALALAWADRRITVSQRTARRADLAFVAVVAVLFVAGTAGALATYGDPVGRAQDGWDEFTSGDRPEDYEGTRFGVGGLGDYRSDYWRVALRQFADAPLLGVGVDNFGAAYIRERRYNEARFPHSTQLAILSGTGLVGSLLFLGFVGCAVAAYLRARRGDALAAAVGAAGILAFLYWFVHGAADWLWEIPALGAPAFALLGAAAAVSGVPRRVSARAGRLGYAAAVALVLGAVVAVPPWFSARQIETATAGWRQQPDEAIEGLERAAALNPLAEQPYLLAGVVANRTGRSERARSLLLDALDRNSVNWYVHYELAVAEASAGRRDAALAALRRAEELNPLEPTIEQVREWVVAGEPIDTSELDAQFRARVHTLEAEAEGG